VAGRPAEVNRIGRSVIMWMLLIAAAIVWNVLGGR
jgi:hypothetical protein